jgi:hypothetical protein
MKIICNRVYIDHQPLTSENKDHMSVCNLCSPWGYIQINISPVKGFPCDRAHTRPNGYGPGNCLYSIRTLCYISAHTTDVTFLLMISISAGQSLVIYVNPPTFQLHLIFPLLDLGLRRPDLMERPGGLGRGCRLLALSAALAAGEGISGSLYRRAGLIMSQGRSRRWTRVLSLSQLVSSEKVNNLFG